MSVSLVKTPELVLYRITYTSVSRDGRATHGLETFVFGMGRDDALVAFGVLMATDIFKDAGFHYTPTAAVPTDPFA